MAILNIISDVINNNGGIITRGGNTKNSQNNTNITSIDSGNKVEKISIGSTVVENKDVTKAVDSYVFGYHLSSRPLVKGATRAINSGSMYHELSTTGTSDTSITTGIHYISWNNNRLDTTAIRNGNFNMMTHKFEPGYPVISEDAFFVDEAAVVDRANPGTLSFKLSGHIVSQSYKSKTG